MMSKIFWKGKKVFITGYEGFLGSNLTKTLLESEVNVCGLDIVTGRKKTILSRNDFSRMEIFRGSVENLSLINEIIKKHKIEIIFHLAAEALVEDCLKNPLKGFSTNIKGTWNILESARLNSCVKGIVIASSDKAYGSCKSLPYKEDTRLSGIHPYDVSKSCADLIAHTYYHSYRVPAAVTRCGNIFGPGDFNFSRIIPDAMRSMINNRTLMVRSDGKFTRDYIYVDDVVKGYILLAEKMHKLKLYGEAFNFSDENPVSVIDLVKIIYKICGKKANYKILKKAKYEIKHQYLSSRKARKILGWKPGHSLEEGLRKTFDWYVEILGTGKGRGKGKGKGKG
ncbi:MAG: GDP-mannose 4,6-dehydratase [Candidatus Omnitrophica bacterium]|nr:GDP-mannose 4,6-dehydratase [Candidatus Omnitrophota bacterium]MDD5429424.1 GDP-mannose 4,6-dehydratase [Candidatus Omnitrophota bacterium]